MTRRTLCNSHLPCALTIFLSAKYLSTPHAYTSCAHIEYREQSVAEAREPGNNGQDFSINTTTRNLRAHVHDCVGEKFLRNKPSFINYLRIIIVN